VHFITRYRKEMTGGLSEHEVRDIEKRYNEFVKVEIRKQFIIESMTKRLPDKLTPGN
jgi:transcriptional accessory protein Tex/SPT6